MNSKCYELPKDLLKNSKLFHIQSIVSLFTLEMHLVSIFASSLKAVVNEYSIFSFAVSLLLIFPFLLGTPGSVVDLISLASAQAQALSHLHSLPGS